MNELVVISKPAFEALANAVKIANQALAQIQGADGDFGNSGGGDGPNNPLPHSDDVDPRAENAARHIPPPGQSGEVRAVHVTVHKQDPEVRKYACTNVRYLPNDDSCNIYVQVLNKQGTPVMVDARMGTGYSGNKNSFDSWNPPGNPNGSFFMGPDSGFEPPNLGPCAVFVVDQGYIVSDVVGSMGLSRGQHGSFYVVFKEL